MSRFSTHLAAPFVWAPSPLLAATLSLLGAAGCGSDSTRAGPVPPPGPPVLRIQSVASAGNGAFGRDALDCVPPGRDDAQTLVVAVGERERNGIDLKNWTFRPFGGCGITPQCGLLVVRVYASGGSEPAVEIASVSADVPIAFGREGLGPGTYTIEAQLIDDAGVPFAIDGGTFQDSIEVTLDDACAPRGDSGVAHDAGLDAGLDARPALTDAEAGAPDGATAVEAGPADAARDAQPSEAGSDAGDASTSDAQALDASMSGDADGSVDGAVPTDATSDAPTGG